MNQIPEMTDPLGRHWNQPKDIRSAPMDGKHVILTKAQISGLSNYDRSMPSGVYSGKCWLRENGKTTWLVWYGRETGPGSKEFRVEHRVVLELDARPAPPAIDVAYSKINALGGTHHRDDDNAAGYNSAIDDALAILTKLGAKDAPYDFLCAEAA